jgi:septum formation protein
VLCGATLDGSRVKRLRCRDVPDSTIRQQVRLVLASASPGRLDTLRRAGLDPLVRVSGVDEECETAPDPVTLVRRLATLKAQAVVLRLAPSQTRTFVLGCDSALEFDGGTYGKPRDAGEAEQRWLMMRGRWGVLHTGHCLIDVRDLVEVTRTASARVWFGQVTESEIADYVASGEPLGVAGGFTIDGLGGAFVDRIDGDPHNVVGLSLPLLRQMLAEFGVSWTSLWTPETLQVRGSLDGEAECSGD